MLVGIALAALAIGTGVWWRERNRPLLPLEVALWYWHQPFRIAPSEAAEWKAVGVRQLYVRAGTFRKEGQVAKLILPEIWAGPSEGLDVHLVFNFDYTLVDTFEQMPLEGLARSVQAQILAERARAERAGIPVVGIELDFDCPTRLLPRYADLLHRLRPALRSARSALSITALPTWFGSGAVEQVQAETDFTVPQYYEPQIPKTLTDFATVSRLSLLERGLAQAGRRGAPFYAGLPAYGHALIYDERGKLLGTYRGMSALDAMSHSSFHLVRAFPADKEGKPASPNAYIGEDIYDFVAVKPAPDGRGLGFHLVYDLPTPALLAQHLAVVRAQHPRNCRGVILFRYPEPGELATLPLPTVLGVLRGERAQPELRVQFQVKPAPWELIETSRSAAHPPSDLTVRVTNIGNASTFLAPDAVTLTLRFNRPGFDAIAPGQFDAVEARFQSDPTAPFETALRSSPTRANRLRIRKFHLAAGETAVFGPIRLPADGSTQVDGEWTAKCPGDFTLQRGAMPPMALTPK
jgi:hypothetical protein